MQYSIIEFTKIKEKKDAQNFSDLQLPPAHFQQLKDFVFANDTHLDEKNKIFNVGRDYIQVKNYVGIIQIANHIQIEILPKIFNENSPENITKSRKILLKMLSYIEEMNFINFQEASMLAEKFPILEIFITLFLKELEILVKKGIKKDYIEEEENLLFLRGKILYGHQIKQNFIRKERFFIKYDEFSENNASNRLIKSTLLLLWKFTKNQENQILIQKNLSIFGLIPTSFDYQNDWKETKKNTRFYNYYQKTLAWAYIFLQKMSWTNLAGNSKCWVLLFPMEKVFEEYVAKLYKEKYKFHQNIEVYLQDQRHHLIIKPEKIFGLRPDIVIKYKETNKIIILDTKWKSITKKEEILQSDLYQMLAYAHQYQTNEIGLIYPKLLNTDYENSIISMWYNHQIEVKIFWIDLE